MEIRKLASENEIFSAIKRCENDFHSKVFNSDEDIRRFSQKFNNLAKVYAAIDDEICGFIAFYSNDLTTRTAFISMIVVRSSSQGKGVGKSLILKACEQCKQNGMEKIQLQVAKSNQNAIQFYQNLGFTSNRTDQQSLFMVKDL